MNPLPPQAYTKETLLKAYAWLQNQNNHIKELATTPDILISLYIKAKMNGNGALETPSIQNFKNELKNLAGMIGEFEGQTPIAENPYRSQNPSLSTTESTTNAAQIHTYQQPAAPAQKISSERKDSESISQELDFRSLTMLREIKNEFNLSSDSEALRLLISVGYKKLKSFS